MEINLVYTVSELHNISDMLSVCVTLSAALCV
jgi:hypothetical protein